jgi:antitoxin (DNA-binding transcriptional repressor) of toxin-antitoxin stability system
MIFLTANVRGGGARGKSFCGWNALAGFRCVRYRVFMKTLSITEARANLSKCCDAALRGQDVAILHNGRLVKLSPVHEVAELSDAEAFPNLDAVLSERARQKARPYTAEDRRRILGK